MYNNAKKTLSLEYKTSGYNLIHKSNKRLIKQSKIYLLKTLYKPQQTGDNKSIYKHTRLRRENSSNTTSDLFYRNAFAGISNMLKNFFEFVYVKGGGLIPATLNWQTIYYRIVILKLLWRVF